MRGWGAQLCPPPKLSALGATKELDSSKVLIIHEPYGENTQKFQLAVQFRISFEALDSERRLALFRLREDAPVDPFGTEIKNGVRIRTSFKVWGCEIKLWEAGAQLYSQK